MQTHETFATGQPLKVQMSLQLNCPSQSVSAQPTPNDTCFGYGTTDTMLFLSTLDAQNSLPTSVASQDMPMERSCVAEYGRINAVKKIAVAVLSPNYLETDRRREIQSRAVWP